VNLRRILFAAAMIALLLGAVCSAYARLAAFHGQMAVATGGREDIVVAPAGIVTPLTAPGVIKNVPARQIPFSDPKTALAVFSKAADYHAAPTPFQIKLDKIDILNSTSPKHFLNISGPGPRQRIIIEPGREISIGGAPFKIVNIQKWSGLLRDPQGTPMAAVTLARNNPEPAATLFLASGVWQATPQDAAVYFTWHNDPQAAPNAAKAGLPGIESARWGVVDRGAVNWFQSFTPGTGATLSTGEEITLLSFDEKRPAIAIEMIRNGTKSTAWIPANQPVDGVPVRFEYPALAPWVFMIHASEDGRALVSAFNNGRPAALNELRAGQWVFTEPAPVNLRLDDVLANAVPVTVNDSTLWAAVLKAPTGEETTLRQGEVKPLGDGMVEFVRDAPPPRLAYQLTIGDNHRATLKPQQSIRIGDWRIQQSTCPRDPYNIAVLDLEYTPARKASFILLAAALTTLLASLALRLLVKAPSSPLHSTPL